MSEPPPLGVYIHWPYCARICPYCDFTVVRDRGRADEQAALIDAILADLSAQRELTGPRELVSIAFGGGTPSRMPPAAIGAVIERAAALWSPSQDLEIGLEANPGDIGGFADLRAAGIERLSVGVQSLRDDALRFLGRDHDAALGRSAVEAAMALFPRVSLDLIYVLPGQTEADWRAELGEALAFGAGHVSAYQLTIEDATAFGRAHRRGQLNSADPDLAADLYETTQAVLNAAGFEAYEVSNHARSLADRSRHNLVYWRGFDYVGVGPGAHGRLTIDGVRTATSAGARIGAYVAAVGGRGTGFTAPEPYNAADTARERLVMGLRTVEGVALAEIAALNLATGTIDDLRDLGLLRLANGRIVATPAGRLVLDSLTSKLALA